MSLQRIVRGNEVSDVPPPLPPPPLVPVRSIFNDDHPSRVRPATISYPNRTKRPSPREEAPKPDPGLELPTPSEPEIRIGRKYPVDNDIYNSAVLGRTNSPKQAWVLPPRIRRRKREREDSTELLHQERDRVGDLLFLQDASRLGPMQREAQRQEKLRSGNLYLTAERLRVIEREQREQREQQKQRLLAQEQERRRTILSSSRSPDKTKSTSSDGRARSIIELRKKRLQNKNTISEDCSDDKRVRKRRLLALDGVLGGKSSDAGKSSGASKSSNAGKGSDASESATARYSELFAPQDSSFLQDAGSVLGGVTVVGDEPSLGQWVKGRATKAFYAETDLQ